MFEICQTCTDEIKSTCLVGYSHLPEPTPWSRRVRPWFVLFSPQARQAPDGGSVSPSMSFFQLILWLRETDLPLLLLLLPLPPSGPARPRPAPPGPAPSPLPERATRDGRRFFCQTGIILVQSSSSSCHLLLRRNSHILLWSHLKLPHHWNATSQKYVTSLARQRARVGGGGRERERERLPTTCTTP